MRTSFTLSGPGTVPTPQVSLWTSRNDHQLPLVLTRPEGYNSGRFILRYDCELRGIPIELEYKSVEISSVWSDVVVKRSRSCFVVGEISRVTVWFVSGGSISSVPAVVNATSGENEIGGTHMHAIYKSVRTCMLYYISLWTLCSKDTSRQWCICSIRVIDLVKCTAWGHGQAFVYVRLHYIQ